jgi:hypothetical protein
LGPQIHIAFMLAPIFLGLLILAIRPRLEPKIRSFNLLVMSMPLFMLGIIGEIGQHIFDNWLYIDFRVSPYYITFFFFTFFSNAVAADALGTGIIQRLVILIFSLAIPLVYAYERYVLGSKSFGILSLIPLFGGLIAGAVFFVIRASLTLGGLCCRQLVLSVLTTAAYMVGVVCGILVLVTGYQFWHLPTALGFLSGFLIQGYWILSVRPLARGPDTRPLLVQVSRL